MGPSRAGMTVAQPPAAERALPEEFTGHRAPSWLPGRHAQTVYPALFARRLPVAYRRERWNLPDGDFIDVDFAHRPGHTEPDGAVPLVVMLHGLEGSSRSHYAEAAMDVVLDRGWRGAVVHWRGCGGEINLAPRAYHSGETDDVDWAFRRLATPGVPLFAIGVSLGGNALLKWLGERGASAARVLAGAVAVSAPHDLHAGAIALASGFNLVYTRNFLRTLKRKSLLKLEQYPGLFDREKLLRARTFHDFDDLVTAPLHGFASCYDYWERCSSKRFVAAIRTPTLVLNARNDPFLPAGALIAPSAVPDDVRLCYPAEGGHAGFMVGGFPGRIDEVARGALEFFAPLARAPGA